MEILVYNEAEDVFRAGRVMVLAKSGLVPCVLEPTEYEHQEKQLLVVCLKNKTWPDALRPYIEKVKEEITAEVNPTQIEIKTILFQPSAGHWACDIYVKGVRMFCGNGFPHASDALTQAAAWIENNPDEIEGGVQPTSL